MTRIPDRWFVSSLRATVFGSHDEMLSARDAWVAVFADEPDESRRTKAGDESCSGVAANRWVLNIAKTVDGRIDLVQQAMIPPNVDFSKFSTLRSYRSVLDDFRLKAVALLANCGSVSRVALGGVLRMRSQGHDGSLASLREMLPTIRLDDGVQDLIYRVNRPGQTRGFRINRVCTWASLVERAFAIGPDGMREGPLQNVVQLEIDMNTDPRLGTSIPTVDLVAVFGDLAEEFANHVDRGDRP